MLDNNGAYYLSQGNVGDGFEIYRIDLDDFSTTLFFSSQPDNTSTLWGLLEHDLTKDALLADAEGIFSFVVNGNDIYYLRGERLCKINRWTGRETWLEY